MVHRDGNLPVLPVESIPDEAQEAVILETLSLLRQERARLQEESSRLGQGDLPSCPPGTSLPEFSMESVPAGNGTGGDSVRNG